MNQAGDLITFFGQESVVTYASLCESVNKETGVRFGYSVIQIAPRSSGQAVERRDERSCA